ncbi:MAG: hypothetical protein ACXAEU_09265 [Candidatus Hodarchaeales archaeon]|jgi:type II secretory pathway pseudopilin PulG
MIMVYVNAAEILIIIGVLIIVLVAIVNRLFSMKERRKERNAQQLAARTPDGRLKWAAAKEKQLAADTDSDYRSIHIG